ncbi:MAG TPA: helix-turn-helix domain-containing protein [Solirubrobacteraceae bacterium]|jgi:hypothetical protein|nr:helix-turn-helix domain-containing protein [Solirubrobacteraceae bacterium]
MAARVAHRTRPATADLVRGVAVDAAADQPALVERVLDRLRAATPELFADPAIAREMTAATRANVSRVHGLLCTPDSLAPEVLPADALDLARASARQLVPLIALLEACRLAQVIISDWWRHRLEATLIDRAELIAASELAHERINAFIDVAAAEVRAIYDEEREAWEGGGPGRRARLVSRLLAGEALDVDGAAGLLGYPLRARHVGLVVWADGAGASTPALEQVAAGVVRRLSAREALTVNCSERAVWVWAVADGVVGEPSAEVSDGVAVAVGPAATGIEGFRQTHRDALEAQRVAVLQGGARAPVTRYEDVEVAAIMSRSAPDVHRFVRRALGALADDDASSARLRETLSAYLASGESQSATARRLGAHRNTIGHRLRAIEDALGPSLGPRRVALELALDLVERLGPPPRAG